MRTYNQQHSDCLLNELLSDNKKKANYLLENMPSIDVYLESEVNISSQNAIFEDENFYIEIDKYCIDCHIQVKRNGYTERDSVYVELNNVYFETDEGSETVSLDRMSIAKLEKSIKNNINIF